MHWKILTLLTCVLSLLTIGSCASVGRPEGGPRDSVPPVLVASNPKPGQLNFKGSRITLTFNENVQLDDAFNKVVVSPAMATAPVVNANGRRVTVELRDTLQSNTTYTVDFGDAVKDLNEGNVLDGLTLDFSTGGSIDTLRISGMVLDAETLEPAQGMLVGVHSLLSDTVLAKRRMERIARTNQLGQFTIRNLAPGTYRVYALGDPNRDYRWDRSEVVGFYPDPVSPSATLVTLTDSLRTSAGADSAVSRTAVRFLPNDLLITTFTEAYRPQYLKENKRLDRRRVAFEFNAHSDSLPHVSVAYGPLKGRNFADLAVLQRSRHNDSLTYWITDPTLLANDTLRLAVNYLKTDSLDRLQPVSDTLRLDFRNPNRRKAKAAADTLPRNTNWRVLTASSHELNQPLVIEAETPIARIDSAAVRLELRVDTVWTPVKMPPLTADADLPLMRRRLDMQWEPGAKYRLTADSAAMTDIYGEVSTKLSHEFTVKKPEDYSSVNFDIQGLPADTALVLQLLDGGDKPVCTVASRSRHITVTHLRPGDYYARVIIDADGNGSWTPGEMAGFVQPEEVYYYPKKIKLKKNWDMKVSWNIFDQPIDLQKPDAIKKNKPKPQPGSKPKAQEQDEEEPDDLQMPFTSRPQ